MDGIMEANPAAEVDSAPPSMDEAQLNQAMKRLKLLHIKLRLLRDTIPRMIEPLVTRQPSPEVMFHAFMKAVDDAQTEVKEFTELMRAEESRQVFSQANKSQEENPFGIKPWRYKDHPDWFNMDKD